MRIEDLSQEVKDKVKQLLDNAPADQKAEAIMQSIEMIEFTRSFFFHIHNMIFWKS